MDYEKQGALILKLEELTFAGKINWQPSAQPGAFQVSFRENTVQIKLRPTVVETEEPDAVDIEFNLYNGEGEVVETFSDVELTSNDARRPDGGIWYRPLLDLYNKARRTALGA